MTGRSSPSIRRLLGALALAGISGCASIEECGRVLGNKEEPRIRSSGMRMLLADPAAASERFAPFAAMSALVYEEAAGCPHPRQVENKAALLEFLAGKGWSRDDAFPGRPACDDKIGMFFDVWTRELPSHREAVLVFRGTKDGIQDWIHGNLRWVTRYLPGEDQYDRSRKIAGEFLGRLRGSSGAGMAAKPLHLYAAGHSLGGGLAQNVLYAYPRDFRQAFAFDPSPVTGYADNLPPERRAGCDCLQDTLGGEARVYRVYETDEILAWLRLPLKGALPLNRQIQEVRFNFGAGHSISALATGMIRASAGRAAQPGIPWWAGKPDAGGQSCTQRYAALLSQSCSRPNEQDYCPN